MWQHLRCLSYYSHIHIGGSEALTGKYSHNLAQEHTRVGALPLWVGIGEVLAYVAEGCGAKQGVG